MLTGYEIEEVICRDGEYSRWFYKYSGTYPDNWVNELAGNPYYDTVDFYESRGCYDLYAATFTIDGVSHYSMLYVFADQPFIAEVGRPGSFFDPIDILNADAYTTNPAAIC